MVEFSLLIGLTNDGHFYEEMDKGCGLICTKILRHEWLPGSQTFQEQEDGLRAMLPLLRQLTLYSSTPTAEWNPKPLKPSREFSGSQRRTGNYISCLLQTNTLKELTDGATKIGITHIHKETVQRMGRS